MSEINPLKPSTPNTVSTTRGGTTERQAGPTANVTQNQSSSEDKVSLTDAATQLQSLQQNIAALSEVDSARVAELRSAIENGEYLVDAQKLAQNMIKFEGQL
jgi:negative regulator of flagellin synthesis FlgM